MKRSSDELGPETAYKRKERKDTGLLGFIKDLKTTTEILGCYLEQIQKLLPSLVLKYNKLGFEYKGYFIVVSPEVSVLKSSVPFLNLEVDVLFEDSETKLELFELTGIVGHHTHDENLLECSQCIPANEWCNVHAKYTKALLPMLEAAAQRAMDNKEQEEPERTKAWTSSVKSIVDGLSAQFPGNECENVVEESRLQSTIWIPVKSQPIARYQIGITFTHNDACFADERRDGSDDNFVQLSIRYSEDDAWELLELDDDSERGFGFIPLYLLDPKDAFFVFMAHFNCVLGSLEDMCKRNEDQ